MKPSNSVEIEIAEPFRHALDTPSRYKVWYGGRGSSKSWNVARVLLQLAYRTKVRVLCAREFQNSIADSVHRLLADQLAMLGLSGYFRVTDNCITSTKGSQFIFKGIRRNIHEIKSLEGIDICWVEEGQRTGPQSWDILIPTIRKPGSEIWVTFNPDLRSDATYQRFVVNPPPDAIVKQVNFNNNPWFPDVLRAEMEYCRQVDEDAYRNIWLGEPREISHALVYANKFRVDRFEASPGAVFYLGADWGFSQDPTVLIRCFIDDRCLYIDHEAYGVGVEIDETPALFDRVPLSRQWKIKADNSRPETISAVRRSGFSIESAKKWAGSVEDGIAAVRQFEAIVVHERCAHTLDELNRYSHKVDPVSGEILPAVVDKHNHCMDAIRYALDEFIQVGGHCRFDYTPVPIRSPDPLGSGRPSRREEPAAASVFSRHGFRRGLL